MKDLSLHLLDIMENSAKAGAHRVDVVLTMAGAWLTVEVADDGPGLPAEVKPDPTDPFRTTRRDRKVGLGLALIRMAAEQTGGRVEVGDGDRGHGVRLKATLNLAHIDAKPVGDLPGAFAAALLAWPAMELTVRLEPGGREALDTVAVKKELDGVSLAHPSVQRFLREQLAVELHELTVWAGSLAAAHGG